MVLVEFQCDVTDATAVSMLLTVVAARATAISRFHALTKRAYKIFHRVGQDE